MLWFAWTRGFFFSSILGGAPSPGNATNHNHATTVTGGTVTGSGGSNFKRQNTVDAATIKENSGRGSATRPSAPKNSPGQLDTSESFFRQTARHDSFFFFFTFFLKTDSLQNSFRLRLFEREKKRRNYHKHGTRIVLNDDVVTGIFFVSFCN